MNTQSSNRRALALLCSAPSALSVSSVLILFFLVFAVPASAQSSPTLLYRKIFKGSSPEFLEIRLSERGSSYDLRTLAEEPDPQPFEVSAATLQRAFALAAQLNNFRDAQLDIKKRIAYLGEKTFRYERGSEVYETKFNYSNHPAALELVQLFEGLGRQQDHLRSILHRMRYDRLGVNNALLNFEADLDRKMIPEPERLLPALEQLAADVRYVDIARQRARMLIERIKSGK